MAIQRKGNFVIDKERVAIFIKVNPPHGTPVWILFNSSHLYGMAAGFCSPHQFKRPEFDSGSEKPSRNRLI